MIQVLTACVPIIVALVGIIPTVLANGRKTQKSIRESDELVKKGLADVQSTLKAHIREDEEDRIRTKRYRILRFFDELCEGKKHSESHFEDVLEDIDDYNQYCNSHPEFQNSRGHVAMVAIREAYARIKAKGGFLMDERSDTND
ncbi:MAG: hypothetical protein IJH78_06685 [Clostridia bacterium]|nr:hypothetical protein [Clostridia bacterium]